MAGDQTELRVFVDANILIAGSVWPRWLYEVLQHALKGDYQLVINSYVLEEARRILVKRFPQHIERFETFIAQCDFEIVNTPTPEEVATNSHLVRDITDVSVVLTAIKAGVDCLVSEDKDLTVRDESTAELRRHLQIYLSGTFLREVMDWSTEQLEAARGRKWQDIAP